MKTENFERAKQIENEIKCITDYVIFMGDTKTKSSERLWITHKGAYTHTDGYSRDIDRVYNPESAPPALINQLRNDIQFAIDHTLQIAERRIKELQKEFDSL